MDVCDSTSETVSIPPCRQDENHTPTDGCPPGTTAARDPRIPIPRKRCRSVGGTLASIGAYQRQKIRAAYRALGGRFARLNDHRREQLSDAIFQVENVLEHRQPSHPQVRIMRAARNRLYDDLGWNERPAPQRSTVSEVA